jgi:hypothetical protein
MFNTDPLGADKAQANVVPNTDRIRLARLAVDLIGGLGGLVLNQTACAAKN